MRRHGLILAVLVTAAAVIAGEALAVAAAAPTLTASARIVPFGSRVTLKGTVPGAAIGEQVQVMATVCGFTGAVPVGFAKTTAGGKYTYSLQPALNSTLFVGAGGAISRKAPIRVKPGVQLRRVGGNTFGVDVSSGNGSWFTKPVIVQRFDARIRAWRTIAAAPLAANSDPADLTAISSATLHVAVKRGTQLRAFVPQSTVGSCYLPSASATITS